MKHISFNPRFVNKAGDDLIDGKIHTIRINYDWWKPYEGKEVALFTWEGKPYGKGSTHKVFCVKRILSVQEVWMSSCCLFYTTADMALGTFIKSFHLMENDGFQSLQAFHRWFNKYKPGKMAILHFTDFQY